VAHLHVHPAEIPFPEGAAAAVPAWRLLAARAQAQAMGPGTPRGADAAWPVTGADGREWDEDAEGGGAEAAAAAAEEAAVAAEAAKAAAVLEAARRGWSQSGALPQVVL
jgi:hypothetical protein